jgi:aspartate racemase
MKTIGLLGGMSWESTVTYYQLLNRGIQERLGGYHSAKILLHSVDFAAVEQCQREDDWEQVGAILSEAARGLERAGAEGLILCSNTVHRVAAQVQDAVDIPLLHIAGATAEALRAAGIDRAALLGTRYVMTQPFWRDVLTGRGITTIVPQGKDLDTVHDIIFGELVQGTTAGESRERLLSVIDALARQGAQGVILGCTELGLLLTQDDVPLPLFDTTQIHAARAVAWMLEENP